MNRRTARSSRSFMQVAGLGLLLAGLLSLLFIPVPSHTFWWKAVNNFGHVPLFGFAAILLLWGSRILIRGIGWSSIRHYGIALLGVLVLALFTEMLQSLNVSRKSEMSDVLADLVGATSGLGLYFTYDSHVSGSWVQWRQFPRNVLLRLCVLLVLGITMLPVLGWSYSYWDRASRFPSLLEFSSNWELDFVNPTDSELYVVPSPEGWKKSPGDLVGKIVFHPKKYPGIRLEEPYSDWRKYTYLKFDIFSELSGPQPIGMRIDDTYQTQPFKSRFNRRIAISPGLNHIQIPLDDIRQAPVDREMDLATIRRVLLFAVNPPEEFTLYFDNIRLE